jgi:predicted transcriptional regulator
MNGATGGSQNILHLTSNIVATYVLFNVVTQSNLADLIEHVGAALKALASEQPLPKDQEALAPAVPIKKSVTSDHIVCLEDGQRFTSLRRHLRTSHGLTPAAYRERWKLPADYPMTSINYARTRAEMARQIGLGRRRAIRPDPNVASQQEPGLAEAIQGALPTSE